MDREKFLKELTPYLLEKGLTVRILEDVLIEAKRLNPYRVWHWDIDVLSSKPVKESFMFIDHALTVS